MTGGIYRPETDGALLAMVNVYKTFPVRKSFFSGEDLRVRAVDGVSLTVAELADDAFALALVPHTLDATTLSTLVPGREVNLEADVLAKYVERLAAKDA